MDMTQQIAAMREFFNGIQADMMALQKVSAEHNSSISAITTILGKNANRAASEVPSRG